MKDDEREVLEDLGLLEPESNEALVCPPEEEPAVPTIYEDCRVPGRELGYSVAPQKTRVVSLDRRQYTADEAATRFEELRAKYGWVVYGQPYFTVRWYCWRIEVRE